MRQVIIKEVIKNVQELNSKGFENGTFYDKYSENHEEAYEDVVEASTEAISEEILDQANLKLDSSEFGNLIYEILRENTREKIEVLVREHIEELFF